MKYFIQTLLLFISLQVISQNKLISKTISQISKADTVCFVADNSGCFHAYVLEVKMCKQKSGDRKLILKSDKGTEEKMLSAKNYKAFIKNYQTSVNHFVNSDKVKCTSITEFELMNKTSNGKFNSTRFKNTSCEAEYNPEMFLQDLIRINEGTKK